MHNEIPVRKDNYFVAHALHLKQQLNNAELR